MSTAARAWLDPLWRLRPEGCGSIEELSPNALPEPFHRLLVHTGDMTSRLEAFHADGMRLEVLRVQEAENQTLLREVVLRRARDGRAVEYGAIKIHLQVFSDAVRAQIQEGRLPLGGLLNRSGVAYFSEPSAFFAVEPSPALRALLGNPRGVRLYGRANVLRRSDGDLIAQIVEVLPPLEKTSAETNC
jgi:chorismate-pyruvate lyase